MTLGVWSKEKVKWEPQERGEITGLGVGGGHYSAAAGFWKNFKTFPE